MAAARLAVAVLPGSAARPGVLRFRDLRLLHGEVYLPVVGYADNFDLYGLSVLDVVVYVVYECVGDLGYVDESAFAVGQGYKSPKFGNAGYLAFEYHSHLQLHVFSLSPCMILL